MGEMEERVARAIAQAWDSDFASTGLPPSPQQIKMARAAIASMREPTQQMIDAVYDHQPEFNCIAGHDLSGDELRDIFRVMIDAALSEK